MTEQISIDYDEVFNEADDSGLADDVLGGGDFIDDIHGLKGLISRALGKLVFKAAIIVVILYNFVYTFYTAFEQSATEETTMIYNNCSCESKDRMFYTIFTFTTIGLWLLFFFVHELFRLYKFIAKDTVAYDGGENGGSEDMQAAEERETRDVEDMQSSNDGETRDDAEDAENKNAENMPQTRKFVIQEFLKIIYHICRLTINNQNMHKTLARHDIYEGVENVLDHTPLAASPKLQIVDKITDIIKCILILLQFAVRLPVVPLLLLQWLDEYAWKCAFGQFKDYCSDGAKSYYVDQSLVVYGFYMCILLAIVIAAMIGSLPTTASLISQKHSKIKYYSKWFLLFKVPRSIYFPNFDFIIVFTLIYTSVLAQFTYSAVNESEEDITSGKLFTINNNWSNVSISGGVSNAVLWECTEQSNSYFFKVVFAIALIIPSLLMLFAIWSPLMVLLRYEKVKELLNSRSILLALTTAVQQMLQHEQSNAEKIKQIITDSLKQTKSSSEIRQSYRWPVIVFILPLFEHALIFLLVALILTSYNLNPLGCFLHTVDYNEITETVLLKASRAVYIYQEVAVSLVLAICVVWIASRVLQIYCTPSQNKITFCFVDVVMKTIKI